MDDNRDLRALNARRWGHIQKGHLQGWYDLEAFKAGTSSLRSIEAEELGDVSGKSILHMQCNCGLDTLSLARLGAQVVGVDLSEKNVSFARSLAQEMGIEARFLCHDVLDLDEALSETFDIVFATYGIFCWIDSLARWMQVAANHLKPGGLLYYLDGHPARWPYDEDGTVVYSYFHTDEALVHIDDAEANIGTYEWQWTVADIVNAAITAGLRVERLGEYDKAAYEFLDELVLGDDGWWRLPGIPHIPLLLSLEARKPRQ